MEMTILRDTFKDNVTLGKLYIDNQYQCEVLEDTDRHLEDPKNEKIKGKTAIPCGTYNVIINMSNRFKCMMPLVEKVPGFEGIRIHAGNTADDTEGCLLLGLERKGDMVLNSRIACDKTVDKMYAVLSRGGKVTLTIKRKEVAKEVEKEAVK